MSGYLELSFQLGALPAEEAEAACFDCGATSVTFSDSRDDPVLEPLPGEFRLWPATRVQALFDEELDAAAAIQALSGALKLEPSAIQRRHIEDRVWEREWLKHFSAMRFGRRLWVCPLHEQVEEPGAVVVRMDPGLAFGTGTHPTTRLCLEWLDEHLPPEARVIDYGCGSGVLALAAVKLGARSASCFDIDPQALIATKDNAEGNGIGERVRIYASADALPTGVDVLLANILSGPLCELAPGFAARVRSGGQVVLAGLMEHEVADVTRAYSPCFDMVPFGHRDGWVGLCGRRH
jgi:ribosomal protein L11 methyltransferase